MSDHMLYSNDLYFEAGVEVKQEQPHTFPTVSASLPIPQRRPTELSDLRDFNLELELCSQDVGNIFQNNSFFKYNDGDSNSKIDAFKMDDDDIFQVDKADLIQGPTLAELNANDETLLGDLNFDDLVLPEEGSFYLQLESSQSRERDSTPSLRLHPPLVGYREGGAFSPCSSVDTGSQQGSPGLGLHEILSPPHYTVAPLLPSSLHRNFAQTRLSSSAPTHLSSEQVWARREPRKHLLSTGSLVEAGSTSSISTGGVLSPRTTDDLSQDEDSDDDSDKYEDFSSDGDDDDDPDNRPLRARMASASKQEKFFWQYNLQAKGPKGQRLVLKTKMEDPHVLNEVTDPVFSPSCSVRGIKHSGKARKGDGNDLTPNPKKLYSIGKELDGLGRVINDMTPVSELPFNVRPKTRKEKNKLASRACRLKKKAQHEANKLKLYGLEHEHKRLLNGISNIKSIIITMVTASNVGDQEGNLDKVVKSATKVKIAGHSSEFVNRVLDKVKAGVPGAGLNEF